MIVERGRMRNAILLPKYQIRVVQIWTSFWLEMTRFSSYYNVINAFLKVIFACKIG
jgi:hypothetical protein